MVISKRREETAAETRRLILAAAKELYLEQGDGQVPTKELARKAGVAEGTIFSHFPDKATLLAAALHDDLHQAIARACETLPPHGACREKVLHLARALYGYYALRPELSRALVKEAFFLSGEWGERVLAEVRGAILLMAGWVHETKAKGIYARDVDEHLAARSMFAAYFAELLMALSAPRFDVEEALRWLDAHIKQLEQGLINR